MATGSKPENNIIEKFERISNFNKPKNIKDSNISPKAENILYITV